MKTTDFIDFMEFTSPNRGPHRINDNECSVLLNDKNNTFYLRFKGDEFKYLRLGKLNGRLCFMLNNDSGILGQVHASGGSTSYAGKEMLFTVLKIVLPDHDKKYLRARIKFDKIEETPDHIIFIFKEINVIK
jgi:hypothetical protein